MTDPHTPRVDGDRLYGRGAYDMKAGVAAALIAAHEAVRAGLRGDVVVAAVADEEHASLGVQEALRSVHADAAIVTEPTDLSLAIGHKGFAWLQVVTHGKAAHGSRPEDGRDAIARMGRVLTALEGRDRELRAQPPAPFQGTGSLHASLISGGRELSSYPDRCTLEMERRTVSTEDGDTVLREVHTILERLKRDDPEFHAEARLVTYRPAHRVDADHPLTGAVAASLARAGRPAAPMGMSFWTDAAILSAAGTPSVLLGPGGAGLHSTEEYVMVDDVYACRDILVDVARGWVG
jgi:acetylornithine deacetylase